jgi:hypothetical protein
MPSIAKLHPSKYLAAADFEGQRLTVTLLEIKRRVIEGGDEDKEKAGDEKAMARFEGVPKLCIWAKTNSLACQLMFSSEFSEKWVGHKITLASRKARRGKQMVDSIRVIGSPEITKPMHDVYSHPRGKITLDMVPTKDARWAPDSDKPSTAKSNAPPPDLSEPPPDLGDPGSPTPEELAEGDGR